MRTSCQKFDVAVIGGGPAGAAAALTLVRARHQVVLLENQSLCSGGHTARPESQSPVALKIGEGLPAASRSLLRELGVWERFCADGHLASHGTQTAWGSSTLSSTDCIRDPHGSGWHLDRTRFDAMLREAARVSGGQVRVATRVRSVARSAAGWWNLNLVTNGVAEQVQASWIIDCSGRSSWLARRQGTRLLRTDRLVGFVSLFDLPSQADRQDRASWQGSRIGDRDSLTLTESTEEGWWYTALLPNGQRVVAYFTDGGTATSHLARTASGFNDLLRQTHYVYPRTLGRGYIMTTPPQARAACSTRLEQVFGTGWIAAGDAAIAFDPLSSQGILTALYTGLRAGQALHSHLNGAMEALEGYSDEVNTVYEVYVRNWSQIYQEEQRWPDSPFWQQRHGLGRTAPREVGLMRAASRDLDA